jgi:hypothetical protein
MQNTITISDNLIRVDFIHKEKQVEVKLTNLKDGMCWNATTPAVLEFIEQGLQRVEKSTAPVARLLKLDDGRVECQLKDSFFGITAFILFSIKAGELVVEIPSDRILEQNKEVALLSGIHILPDLIEVNPAVKGHLVVPMQTGILCWPERHQRYRDAFLIYGQQNRWEDLPLVPCCGAVREQASSALMVIAAQGDCDAECRVDLDGKGRGDVSFAMRYRYTPIDPVDPIDRRIVFVPLSGEAANYAGMGRRMFRHIQEVSGRKPIAERIAGNSVLEYISTAYTVKIFHASKPIGPLDGSGEYKVWVTCDQAIEQLGFLKKHGIERVWTQSVGWNPDGHDGYWPTRFPIDERIGGESGFRKLIAEGQKMGYITSVHDNYLDNYKLSPHWNADICVGDIYGRPLKQGLWGGGQNHRGWGLALPDSMLRDQLLRMKDLGIKGAYYIDAMGMPLEISYNLKHGARRYRRACAEGQVRIMKEAETIFGCTGTEMGFMYIAPYVDSIATACYPRKYIANRTIVDRMVPLAVMALKGHITFESEVTHRYGVGSYPGQELWRFLLDLAECGIRPRLETSYVVGLSGYPLEAYIKAVKEANKLMLIKLKNVCFSQLVDHKLLAGDTENGTHVVQSVFADGTKIICNYAERSLSINGENWQLPLDYVGAQRLKRGERPVSQEP